MKSGDKMLLVWYLSITPDVTSKFSGEMYKR